MLQSSTTSKYVFKIHAAAPCMQWWLNPPPQETANFAFPGQVYTAGVQTPEKLSISILYTLLEVQGGPG